MVWYIFRHNVAACETYIPNGGEEICSEAHGRRASSEQSKILCSRSSNFPCFSFEPGASGLTAGPFACYRHTSRRHGILSSCNYLIQTHSTRLAHRLGHVPAGHGVLGRVLDCQGMTESVMVGRESDMQKCPPRGSPVCPPRGSPVCSHRQACPPSRRDSHRETLK
jgi:hypothetical protein